MARQRGTKRGITHEKRQQIERVADLMADGIRDEEKLLEGLRVYGIYINKSTLLAMPSHYPEELRAALDNRGYTGPLTLSNQKAHRPETGKRELCMSDWDALDLLGIPPHKRAKIIAEKRGVSQTSVRNWNKNRRKKE